MKIIVIFSTMIVCGSMFGAEVSSDSVEPLYYPHLFSEIQRNPHVYLVKIDKTNRVPTENPGLVLITAEASISHTVKGSVPRVSQFTFSVPRTVGYFNGRLPIVSSWSAMGFAPVEGQYLLSFLSESPDKPLEPITRMELQGAIRVFSGEVDEVIKLCNITLPQLQNPAESVSGFSKIWSKQTSLLERRHLCDYAVAQDGLHKSLMEQGVPADLLSKQQPLDFRAVVIEWIGKMIVSKDIDISSAWIDELAVLCADQSDDSRLRERAFMALNKIVSSHIIDVKTRDALRARLANPSITQWVIPTYNYKMRRNGYGFLPENLSERLESLRSDVVKILGK